MGFGWNRPERDRILSERAALGQTENRVCNQLRSNALRAGVARDRGLRMTGDRVRSDDARCGFSARSTSREPGIVGSYPDSGGTRTTDSGRLPERRGGIVACRRAGLVDGSLRVCIILPHRMSLTGDPDRSNDCCGCSSVVEHHVANVDVVGSNPITRFSGVLSRRAARHGRAMDSGGISRPGAEGHGRGVVRDGFCPVPLPLCS